MKYLSAAISLAIFGQHQSAAQLACPSELTSSQSITSTLTMYYAIVLGSDDSEKSIMCARIESDSESWIGWGINPSGGMSGAEAVIGLPSEGKVSKYILYAESADAVVEMTDQTLMDTSITQENGMTVMSFTKYLDEDKYGIFPSGRENSFIYAVGASNDLAYHAERGSFGVDFAVTATPASGSDTTAPSPSAVDSSNATSAVPTASSGIVAPTSGAPSAIVTEALDGSLPPTTANTSLTGGVNMTLSPTSATTSMDEGVMITLSPTSASASLVGGDNMTLAPTSSTTGISTAIGSAISTTIGSSVNTTSTSPTALSSKEGFPTYSPTYFPTNGDGTTSATNTTEEIDSSSNATEADATPSPSVSGNVTDAPNASPSLGFTAGDFSPTNEEEPSAARSSASFSVESGLAGVILGSVVLAVGFGF
eukprot:g10119.t1 g10119   contig4:1256734-1258005(+)